MDDFGTAVVGSQTGFSARWTSPELLEGLISNPTKKCDVYSFGCFCVEVSGLFSASNVHTHR